MRRFGLLTVLLFSVAPMFGQDVDIQSYVDRIESGDGDEVSAELPALMRNHPGNPGVLYVQALLTIDGAEAARIYQDIVDKYPQSEWADDALWKTHKFYSAIGLSRTAEMKLQQLRANYPGSRYLIGQEIPAETAERREDPPPAEKQPEPLARDTSKRVGETVPPPPVTTTETPKPDEQPKQSATVPTEPTSREARPTEKKIEPADKYTLQVGAYAQHANASRQKQFFEYRKHSAEVVRKMKGSKELFYVYVGDFATSEEAQRAGDDLKRTLNIDFIVTTR